MLSKAFSDVLTERGRQMTEEGWTFEHDDQHKNGEMARAAACYAWAAALSNDVRALMSDTEWSEAVVFRRLWPWDAAWWKPKDRRRDLVRAAALIVAEIERLDRRGTQA